MAAYLDSIATGTPLLIFIPEGRSMFSQRLQMDGREYNVVICWNQLMEQWFLSLYDAEDSPLVLGLAIHANWPLLRYYKGDTRLPPGEIIAQDLTGSKARPAFDDFGIGKRVELAYFAQGVAA